MSRERIHGALALGILLAGILLTLHAMWRTPPVAGQIRAKLEDLNQIRQGQAIRRREDQAVAGFDRMPEHAPVALRAVVGRLFPGLPSAVHVREGKEAVGGWMIREADIVLDRAPLAEISRLLVELQGDGNRPPWQLMECQVKASEQTPGYGAVTLGLRALEK